MGTGKQPISLSPSGRREKWPGVGQQTYKIPIPSRLTSCVALGYFSALSFLIGETGIIIITPTAQGLGEDGVT